MTQLSDSALYTAATTAYDGASEHPAAGSRSVRAERWGCAADFSACRTGTAATTRSCR